MNQDIQIRKDFLSDYLKQNNLTEREFAKLIGVAHSTVNRVLNGKRNPGSKFIAGILKRFPELTFEELFIFNNNLPKGDRTA
ncbi:helix-turn-helix transcriptional regulator [Lysinibacillus sp. NPDC047702]|uniref:helix-turn-helix transcriptional regulator n=1 Tax=unclassified Lysinibacillus TaxID=2636778 RepID=UPI003CFDCD09